MSTADRLLTPGWWPTKGLEPHERYVGSSTCAGCHSQIAGTQETTAMAHASALANSGAFSKPILGVPLTAHFGPYSYEISETPSGFSYSVSDGRRSVTTPLGWVFGSGHFGQTYVYQQKGIFYESHLSYYPGIGGLDFTAGHKLAPASVDKALAPPRIPIPFAVALVAIQLHPPPVAALIPPDWCRGLVVNHATVRDLSTLQLRA